MARIRIGVVGCGGIAQVQHLPNLAARPDDFEIAVLCDRSARLASSVAEDFHVSRHVTDYRDLLAADVDAVLLCHGDPKTEIAVASLEAGVHTFIEKPMCYTLADADAIIDAARTSNRIAQMGYMKVYDPAFELAQREVSALDSIRFIQANHMHTANAHYLRQFRLRQADDLPERPKQRTPPGPRTPLGEIPPHVERAFFVATGSMIHDIYGLRLLFGLPERVVSTEIWNGGQGITTILEYGMGARCALTWVESPDVRAFKETVEVYADDRRITLSYPTGYARGILSTVTIHGVDADDRAYTSEPAIEWEGAFMRELRHFHACIVDGETCRTPVDAARDDVALLIDIVRRHVDPS